MAWPKVLDYNEAIQCPSLCFEDAELRQGEPATNAMGWPMPCTGNFAAVYKVSGPNQRIWAVKCFTREVPNLQQRYQHISEHIQQTRQQGKLSCMVDFEYLERGIRVGGLWYPILKMRWIEGFSLNGFVKDHLDKPQTLIKLAGIWLVLARKLRAVGMAHGDLQHGNVILVPKPGGVSLRLIDYDGMFVPALAGYQPSEIGHSNYQHPARSADPFHAEVDNFPHLVLYTALSCLAVGGRLLWERYDNGENLLFREADLKAPGNSQLFLELMQLPDATAQALVSHLILACERPLRQVPVLDALVSGDRVLALNQGQEGLIDHLLGIVPGQPMIDPAPGTAVVGSPPAPPVPAEPWWKGYIQESPPAPLFPTALPLQAPVPGHLPLPRPTLKYLAGAMTRAKAALAQWACWRAVLLAVIWAFFAGSVGRGAGTVFDSGLAGVLGAMLVGMLLGLLSGSMDDSQYHSVYVFPPGARGGALCAVVGIAVAGALGNLGCQLGALSISPGHFGAMIGAVGGGVLGAFFGLVLYEKSTYFLVRLVVLSGTGCCMALCCCGLPSFPATSDPSDQAKASEELPEEITNSVGMKLKLIPAGVFTMGSPETEKSREAVEGQHEVEITKPFYMGIYEVTQEEYQDVVGTNPSWFSATGDGKDRVTGLNTGKFPVENVSWTDAVTFCEMLSERPAEKQQRRVYGLPTEAEWEYACRGGGRSYQIFHFGASLFSKEANFFGKAPSDRAEKRQDLVRTCAVGSYGANAFGLYDMHGNVWEWCSDWYEPDYYTKSPRKDPTGPGTGTSRVLRGGGWSTYGRYCRAAYRDYRHPSRALNEFGFRVVVRPAPRAP